MEYLGYNFTKSETLLQKSSEMWRQLLQSNQLQTKLLIFTKFWYYSSAIFCCQMKWLPEEPHLKHFLLSSQAAFN